MEIGEWVERVRNRHPLVHSVTNLVAMQISANVLLAVGASPIMAHAVEEVADIAKMAGALVLNIGTLDADWVRSMELAARAAQGAKVPIVLDPVGVGATAYRTRIGQELLLTARPKVVRGNGGEILALMGARADVRGVDAGGKTATRDHVAQLARSARAVIAATGSEDIVSDGHRVAVIQNGHPWLTQVTAAGCSLSGLVGAFLAASRPETDRYMEATVAALVYFEVAAERAAQGAKGPGTFAVALLDQLATVEPEEVTRAARVRWE